MSNPPSRDTKDQDAKCFGDYEREMQKMGIADYSEGLKKVFEKWLETYSESDLLSILSHILWEAKRRQISFDEKVVDSIHAHLSREWVLEFSEDEEPLFTRSDFISFLCMNHHGRPDILLCKVMMIIGFSSMARCEEMRGITIYHIKKHDGVYTIGLRRAKLNDDGIFSYYTLLEHMEDVDTNQIVDEYLELRHQVISPEIALFMRPSATRYGYEKRAIGKNQFSKMTCLVAELLGKPNPEDYTLHTLRHSVATILADGGASAEELRLVGGWKGIKAPLEYIRRSREAKRKQMRETNSLNEWIRLANQNSGHFEGFFGNGNYVRVTIYN